MRLDDECNTLANSTSDPQGRRDRRTDEAEANYADEDATPAELMLACVQGQHSRHYLEYGVIAAEIHSPTFHRMKAVESCIRTLFPRKDWTSAAVVTIMSRWIVPLNTPMGLGNDSVALLDLGCILNDDRLLLEGRKRHLATVQALRRELQRPKIAFEGVLATALDLLFCEVYRPVASVLDSETWTRHLAGLSAVMKISERQPDSQISGSWLSLLYGQMDLMHALVHRRPMLFGEGSLRSNVRTAYPGSVDVLFQLSARLPLLLQATDRFCASKSDDHSEKARIGQSLLNLEDSLFCWLTKFKPSAAVLKACAAPPSEITSEPLIFDSYFEGMALNFYWVTRLLIAQCLLDLESLLPPEHAATESSSCQDFAVEAERFASLLCRSIPSMAESCGGMISKGLAMRAPLHFAGRWYERSGYAKGLEWCKDVECQLRGEMAWLNWDALLPWSFVALLWLER